MNKVLARVEGVFLALWVFLEFSRVFGLIARRYRYKFRELMTKRKETILFNFVSSAVEKVNHLARNATKGGSPARFAIIKSRIAFLEGILFISSIEFVFFFKMAAIKKDREVQ